MSIKRKLFSSTFFKSMIADLGGRTSYTKDNNNFIPYFQYRIGLYQPDQYLYFSKEPYTRRYNNEIFNKLNEYNGYDIIKYLEFHYAAYEHKGDFLNFLKYELAERQKQKISSNRKLKLQSAQDWVSEKLTEEKILQEKQLRNEIEKEVNNILQKQPNDSGTGNEVLIKNLSEILAGHIEQLMTDAEKGIKAITQSFITGNIQLNNRNNEKKLVELLIMIQETCTSKSEQLFKKCSSTDIAALLHLHFDAFKDKKINTIQKKIAEYTADLHNTKSHKVEKLNAALQDFFD